LSYLMVHLTIGYKLLEIYPDIEDKGAFLLGTISPDAIMFRSGCERSDKSMTHFCTGDEGWGFYTNYDEWTENLIENIHNFYGSVNKNFLFGYMSHIITDIENTRCFWTPARLSNDDTYKRTYLRDSTEIDSILLNTSINIDELWSILENSNKHCLTDLYSIEDNSIMIEKMKSEMYYNRYPTPGYTPSVYTIQKVSKFMDEVICKIRMYKHSMFDND
jgi:hypothetical protein